jgi:hypothetical protein
MGPYPGRSSRCDLFLALFAEHLFHGTPSQVRRKRSGGRARTSNLKNQNLARCQLRHPRMGEPPI